MTCGSVFPFFLLSKYINNITFGHDNFASVFCICNSTVRVVMAYNDETKLIAADEDGMYKLTIDLNTKTLRVGA